MEFFIIIIVLGIILFVLIILNDIKHLDSSTNSIKTTSTLASCTKTKFGCCPDGVNSKVNLDGTNCPIVKQSHLIGGCNGTRYGCCPDNRTPKMDPPGTNCVLNSEPNPAPQPGPKKPIGGCNGTRYGCCPDNNTPKSDPSGSNCLLR